MELVFLLYEWRTIYFLIGSPILGETVRSNVLFLPIVHMCDCRRPVAKDPGLDVHGPCFGVSYGHIYYPLQAFTFDACKESTNVGTLLGLIKHVV